MISEYCFQAALMFKKQKELQDWEGQGRNLQSIGIKAENPFNF